MRPRLLILIVVITLVTVGSCLLAFIIRDSGTEEEGKTVGVILAGPRSYYGWEDVTGEEYAEVTIGKDRVILFDNLNSEAYPNLTLHTVVSNMLSSGARAFFISSYTPEEAPIGRQFPNTVFIHNVSFRWEVEDMLPDLVIVATGREGPPPPPGTTPDDITVWIFGIGGLVVAALLVFIIGILNARYTPADRRRVVTRLIERITQKSTPKKKASKSPGIHAQGLRIEQAVADRATNFSASGEPEPLLHKLSTYVQGDQHYDESFAIERNGTFLGECGVGRVPHTNRNDPDKSAALEVWLFDKNDIKTASRFVVSEHLLQDGVLLARLKGKGEVVVAEQDAVMHLETQTLRMQARILAMQYGYDPALPARSFFEHLVVELAIWCKS